MTVSALSLLLGCTGASNSPTYALHLTPVTSAFQTPFDGVDSIDLVITPAVGDPLRVSLGAPSSGGTPEVTGLPPIEDAHIVVEGFSGGSLALRGRTESITASEGDVDATVFVARTDANAWLQSTADGLYLPLVLPLGDGRFWIGGGAINARNGGPKKSSELAYTLTLAPPTEGLGLEEAGAMPEWTDADGVAQIGRMGATGTPLTVAGADQGKVLVVGGASANQILYDGQTTAEASLLDPATGAWEVLESTLTEPRSLHLAQEDLLGNVVLWGGLGTAESDGINLPSTLEYYDRANRSFVEVGTTRLLGNLGAHIASLGSEGTLLCGGASVAGTGWSSEDACVRVPLGGGEIAEAESMPESLAGAAMVTLADGRVLLTGGASSPDALDDNEEVAAGSSAWTYDPDTGRWSELPNGLAIARAGHRMVLLPDERVLIVGGTTSYNPIYASADATSCVEIYEPRDDSFAMVDDCAATDDAGGLPGRVIEPTVALDPDYGALIVGGLDAEGNASTGLSIFMPRL